MFTITVSQEGRLRWSWGVCQGDRGMGVGSYASTRRRAQKAALRFIDTEKRRQDTTETLAVE